MTSSVRIVTAVVIALALIALAGRAGVQAGSNSSASFDPDPLEILEGGTATLTVSFQKDLTADEASSKEIHVNLIIPGTTNDTEVASKTIPVTAANPQEGQTVSSLIADFSLMCNDDGKIVGDLATVDSPAEFTLEFPDPAPDEYASGTGTVECKGVALVEFDPNPLEIEEGAEETVKVTFTKHLTPTEATNSIVTVRLMEQGTDTLLGTKNIKIAGQTRIGQKVTRTTSFQLQCKNDEIRGINGTGEASAPLAVEFTEGGKQAGDGLAECIERTSSTSNSGGSHPSDVAIDEATGTAYVVNAFDGAVGVFQGDQLTDTLQLPCPEQPAALGQVTLANEPGAEAFNCVYQGLTVRQLLTGFYLLTVDQEAALLWIYFLSLISQSDAPPEPVSVAVGDMPSGLAQDPVTGNVYVANSGDGTVSVVDPEAQTVIDTINVGGTPEQVAADPSAGIVYVTNFTDDAFDVIDTSTNTVVNTISVGNGADGIAVNPLTGDIYVTNFIDDTLSVVPNPAVTALPSVSAISTVAVGNGPIDVDYNPLTNRIFVVNANDDTLSVVDATALEVTATLPTGITPDGVAVNPGENLVYVVNHDVNSVTIYSDTSPYDERPWGDMNCDGSIGADDALPILRWAGGLVPEDGAGCPGVEQPVRVFGFADQAWGDVNCDGVIDAQDALLVVLYAGGQVTNVADCPSSGDTVLVN